MFPEREGHVCMGSAPRSCPTLSTPWTVQVPLSLGFPSQEHWTGLLFPSPGDLPDPGIEPESATSPALASGFFTTVLPGSLTGQGLPLKNNLKHFFPSSKGDKATKSGKESHNHQSILIQGAVCRCVAMPHISSDDRAANCPTDRRGPQTGLSLCCVLKDK